MNQSQKLLVNHSFHGGRFEDHGVDVDALTEIVRYKSLLMDLTKELWRRNNPNRERLPNNFEEGLALKFYEVKGNCATIPLMRAPIPPDEDLYAAERDELDEAVDLVAQAIDAAGRDVALPDAFPQALLAQFEDYGKTLRPDEWIEQTPAGSSRSYRFDAVVRERLTHWLIRQYQGFVDLCGMVTMARVNRPRMALELPDGREIEAAFRPEDESEITAALQQHATAQLRVIGQGQFGPDGRLQRIVQIDKVIRWAHGAIPFDAQAKPIWEAFAEELADVPPEEWAKLPTDGAERHDEYIYGLRGNP